MASAEVGDHRAATRPRWSREGVFTTTTHEEGTLKFKLGLFDHPYVNPTG
jgi:hypothetical protein